MGLRERLPRPVDALLPRLSRITSFRMGLPAARNEVPGWSVVELGRDELRGLPPDRGFCADLDSLDRVAPEGWRCFVVLSDREPVHQSFVRAVPAAPRLFRSQTAPGHRGRGAFRALVRHVAGILAAEGKTALHSACAARNVRSRRAHVAAGFEVVEEKLLVTLRGRTLVVVRDPLAALGRLLS